jgi:hypothetical protein
VATRKPKSLNCHWHHRKCVLRKLSRNCEPEFAFPGAACAKVDAKNITKQAKLTRKFIDRIPELLSLSHSSGAKRNIFSVPLEGVDPMLMTVSVISARIGYKIEVYTVPWMKLAAEFENHAERSWAETNTIGNGKVESFNSCKSIYNR